MVLLTAILYLPVFKSPSPILSLLFFLFFPLRPATYPCFLCSTIFLPFSHTQKRLPGRVQIFGPTAALCGLLNGFLAHVWTLAFSTANADHSTTTSNSQGA